MRSRPDLIAPAFAEGPGEEIDRYYRKYEASRYISSIERRFRLEAAEKGRGSLEFERVEKCPAVIPIGSFSVKREAGRLEGFQVAADRSYFLFPPLGDLGYGQSI